MISVKDNVVTVEFARGAQVQEAARYFVLPDAVRSTQGKGNPIRAVGGWTSRPDLTDVRRLTDTIFDFTFDEDIALGQTDRFLVYTANGTPYRGRGATRINGTTVRVFFPPLRYIGHQMVMAAVEEGAVIVNDGSGHTNTVGHRTVWSGASMRTAGPDLVDVQIDRRSGLVTFVFDADINHSTRLEELRPENFLLLTSTGDLARGLTVAGVEGRRVLVHFPTADVRDMRGASVNAGAVTDDERTPNPPGTVVKP